MKKFINKYLQKLPVLIVASVLTIAWLITYIVLLCRPMSYGMTYKYQGDLLGLGDNSCVAYFTPTSQNSADVRLYMEDAIVDFEVWIYYDDGKIGLVGTKSVPKFLEGKISNVITYAEYKNFVRAIQTNDTALNLFFEDESSGVINSYRMVINDQTAVCAGTIWLTVLGGMLLVALMGTTALSVLKFVATKKHDGRIKNQMSFDDLLKEAKLIAEDNKQKQIDDESEQDEVEETDAEIEQEGEAENTDEQDEELANTSTDEDDDSEDDENNGDDNDDDDNHDGDDDGGLEVEKQDEETEPTTKQEAEATEQKAEPSKEIFTDEFIKKMVSSYKINENDLL